jgi:predicted nucleic acid-binding protein
MSAERIFVDTNVLTYLFDDAEPKKQAVARQRLAAEADQREIVTSTQVLQELYVSLTRGKLPIASEEVAERAVRDASGFHVVQIDVPLVFAAMTESRRSKLSFWDALVVRAAAQAGCIVLLTEDLNDGQDFDGVRVESPFR